MHRAVNVRAELHAFVCGAPKRLEREDLVTAAIGQNRLLPADEAVEPSKALDDSNPGTQVEMVGVAQKDLGTEFLNAAMVQCLNCSLGCNGHEGRGFNHAVGGLQQPYACSAIRSSCHNLERPHCSTYRLQFRESRRAIRRLAPMPTTSATQSRKSATRYGTNSWCSSSLAA